jgi:hypothetical protein
MHEQIVDYAYPCMMAEKFLREAHQAMLTRDYEKAIDLSEEATAECRLMSVAIKHMKEQEHALRQQAASI